jgi:hypothetical protein
MRRIWPLGRNVQRGSGSPLASGSPGRGASPVTAAKAYRLLKAIMNTAVDDGLIRRNPCRIKGAAQDRSPEREILTVRQVFTLASVIDLVELSGLEPLTPCLQSRCSSN